MYGYWASNRNAEQFGGVGDCYVNNATSSKQVVVAVMR
jgi:hypothetical protein